MKKIAIMLNLSLIALLIFFLIREGGFSGASGGEILIFIIVLITPLCSLYTILGTNENGWLNLFLQRKALEEKKKIEKLKETKL